MTMSNTPKGLSIAVVTETYPPEINGVANTMRHLVGGLARRGHRVHLVRPRQGPRERTTSPGEVEGQTLVPGVPLPGYRGLRFGLPVYWRLRRLWRANRPHVAYIATQGPLGHAALNATRAAGIPAVTGFHTQFDQYSQHYGLGLLTHQIGQTLKDFHNRSDATLVPTAELRQQLAAQGFRNLHLFGRGVDTRLFDPARRDPALRAAWGCGDEDLVVLYVGRLAAEKNLDLALAAFAAIAAQEPAARFVLVGDGPGLERLRREHPQYRFVGPKVGEQLAAHYASGDLFLFPSLTETFGNVVPEAMASGLAVVAFDYAAAHAYLVPWHNGVTVATGDRDAFIAAALALAGDRARLRTLGRQARVAAADLDWDRVICGVERQLQSVIRRRSGSENRHETVVATTQ
ncbi:glycosyltransferase family 4 protein [Thiococcus pfennigii]|uniref:glycosyltransferase family 4 protein n=1 Tax=Thiococcus pfennigii TaxID=1057 RepID=UPI0019053F11|nr:glycosyltransferase family 1 protein [Thiococcus pfennigii]MBK1701180.1 glycoside hydrolase [Thiococcus pfennigii]